MQNQKQILIHQYSFSLQKDRVAKFKLTDPEQSTKIDFGKKYNLYLLFYDEDLNQCTIFLII